MTQNDILKCHKGDYKLSIWFQKLLFLIPCYSLRNGWFRFQSSGSELLISLGGAKLLLSWDLVHGSNAGLWGGCGAGGFDCLSSFSLSINLLIKKQALIFIFFGENDNTLGKMERKKNVTLYMPLVQHHQLLSEFEALLYILLPYLCTNKTNNIYYIVCLTLTLLLSKKV